MNDERVRKAYDRLKTEAKAGGYLLNPDESFSLDLVRGLLINEDRYGYPACPCRLAEGTKEADLDIICPCDYRDADLVAHGACYCALYVSEEVATGRSAVSAIPERRPSPEERAARVSAAGVPPRDKPLPWPVWRCRVCGYLCAREEPPGLCPICKAKRDRFERFF